MDRRHFVAAVTALTLSLAITGICTAQMYTATQTARSTLLLLRIDGIPGDSMVDRHKGDIDIDSYSWVESRAASGMSGGGSAGRINMGSFHFSTRASQASPRLFQACASGQVFRSAVLTVWTTQQERQYWRMWDVTVHHYKNSLDLKKDLMSWDEFSLDFARIELDYRPVSLSGGPAPPPIRSGWDVRANRPF
jgi:type VI secretion system secreted protein Hcp